MPIATGHELEDLGAEFQVFIFVFVKITLGIKFCRVI